MSSKPPPIPLKYKLSAQEAPPEPKRAHLPPPRKLPISNGAAVFRTVIVVVILFSTAVGYWSFFHHLAPLQNQSRSMLTRVSRISAQLDGMERQWTPEQTKEIRERYSEVHAQLFADREALKEWLGQLQSQAAPLALDVNVGVGQAAPTRAFTNSLAVIPAALSLEVLPETGETQDKSPYDRILALSQQLAGHGKRADLSELSVNGGTHSITRATLLFNLWAGEVESEPAVGAPQGGKK
jgi:hypothetical protein